MGDHEDPSEAKTEVATRRKTRCLPQDMLFEIFLRLTAQFLHDVVRHVCIEWNLIISSQDFIYHHVRNSNPGLMIQDWYWVHNAIYVEMRQGCLEIYKFDSRFEYMAFTSCNGLVLAFDSIDRHILYVINPLTKQRIILPLPLGETGFLVDFCLAFVEVSMEYKVVRACFNKGFRPRTQIGVLTIGVDKVWRHIDLQHISPTTREALKSPPWVTGGYVHWVGKNSVLTFNVETETMHRFPIPKICGKFLPMGSNLSVANNKPNESFMDIWEMNSETGEWTILFGFGLEPLIHGVEDLFCQYANSIVPSGWLVPREVLVFSTIGVQRRCITYNVKTRQVQLFELDTNEISRYFRPHVNSLVRLEGEFYVGQTTKEMGNKFLSRLCCT